MSGKLAYFPLANIYKLVPMLDETFKNFFARIFPKLTHNFIYYTHTQKKGKCFLMPNVLLDILHLSGCPFISQTLR